LDVFASACIRQAKRPAAVIENAPTGSRELLQAVGGFSAQVRVEYWAPQHVAADRFPSNFDSEAKEFTADALRAPERIVARHLEAESLNRRRDPRSTGERCLLFQVQ
jgi:hypothetical protein